MSTFEATGLKPEILKAVSDLGFTNPTPIQQKAIPFLLGNDRDLIALAQTGTGKTAGFGLPLIDLLDPRKKSVQSLILCPTRELCLQITSDLNDFARHLPRVRVVAIYGGANINTQIKQIRQGAQIIVGTPGRTLDLIRQRQLNIGEIDVLVLDEADEMLDRGFKHDLDAILSTAPKDKRTWLFSATMPDEISRISRQYLYDPESISVGKLNAGADMVEHEYYVYPTKGRYNFLRDLLKMYGDVYGIVFCRTKRKAREVAKRLHRDGFNAEPLHGDMSQPQRDKAMARFRTGKARILVATDVAARGVDIDSLTHVINYDLPDVDEVYIHRSGRTGRAQREGISIAILAPEETRRVRALEKLARKRFAQKTLGDITPVNGSSSSMESDSSRGEVSTSWDNDELWPAEKKSTPKKEQPYKLVYNKLDEILNTVADDQDLPTQFKHINEYLGDIPKEDLIACFVSYLSNKGEFRQGNSGSSNGGGKKRNNRNRSRNKSRQY